MDASVSTAAAHASAMDDVREHSVRTPAFPGRKQACARGPPALVPIVRCERLAAADRDACISRGSEHGCGEALTPALDDARAPRAARRRRPLCQGEAGVRCARTCALVVRPRRASRGWSPRRSQAHRGDRGRARRRDAAAALVAPWMLALLGAARLGPTASRRGLLGSLAPRGIDTRPAASLARWVPTSDRLPMRGRPAMER